jgi:hypothetical protein
MQNSPSNDLLFPSRGGFCTIRPSRARMVELVDTRDLKSRGPGRVRAGSSPAPGTKINNFFGGAIARWPLYYVLNGTGSGTFAKIGIDLRD